MQNKGKCEQILVFIEDSLSIIQYYLKPYKVFFFSVPSRTSNLREFPKFRYFCSDLETAFFEKTYKKKIPVKKSLSLVGEIYSLGKLQNIFKNSLINSLDFIVKFILFYH